MPSQTRRTLLPPRGQLVVWEIGALSKEELRLLDMGGQMKPVGTLYNSFCISICTTEQLLHQYLYYRTASASVFVL